MFEILRRVPDHSVLKCLDSELVREASLKTRRPPEQMDANFKPFYDFMFKHEGTFERDVAQILTSLSVVLTTIRDINSEKCRQGSSVEREPVEKLSQESLERRTRLR